MPENFILIHRHRQGSLDQPFNNSFPGAVVFETCLRRMLAGFAETHVLKAIVPEGQDQVLVNLDAYRFMLEVVCGLHSPVKGETEIQGQFRAFIESLNQGPLKVLMQEILKDARQVRTQFLNGLGSQSYGSFARRRLRETDNVHIVGTGQLAEELFPWISKIQGKVYVFGRNVQKLEILKSRYSHFQLGITGSPAISNNSRGALVVAAPVSSMYLREWMGADLDRYSLILDYRSESSRDPITATTTILNLNEIFKELEATRSKVTTSVQNAMSYIEELVSKKTLCS